MTWVLIYRILVAMSFRDPQVWRSGENLSAKDIGNKFTAFQIFGGETV